MPEVTRPRVMHYKFPPTTQTATEARAAPKKSNLPDMGSYTVINAFNYTQRRKGPSQKWGTLERKSVVDNAVKATKGKPTPTTYKVSMQHYSRLSPSPPSIRTRRH